MQTAIATAPQRDSVRSSLTAFILVKTQVLVAFPRVHGAAIALVLLEFGIAKGVVEMVAERGANDRVGVKLGDRLPQRFRQRSDAAFVPFGVGQIVRRSNKRRTGQR